MRAAARRRLIAGAIASVALAGMLLFGPRPGAPGESSGPAGRPPVRGTVTHVYDGDTLEVSGVGKVRLTGVDAMDAHNEERTRGQAARYGLPEQVVRELAERATRFARERAEGRRVTLQFGEELRDDYGRVLAYVHVGGDDDLNMALIEDGLAAAYRAFPHPRRAAYVAAEGRARLQRQGMWRHARVHP